MVAEKEREIASFEEANKRMGFQCQNPINMAKEVEKNPVKTKKKKKKTKNKKRRKRGQSLCIQ